MQTVANCRKIQFLMSFQMKQELSNFQACSARPRSSWSVIFYLRSLQRPLWYTKGIQGIQMVQIRITSANYLLLQLWPKAEASQLERTWSTKRIASIETEWERSGQLRPWSRSAKSILLAVRSMHATSQQHDKRLEQPELETSVCTCIITLFYIILYNGPSSFPSYLPNLNCLYWTSNASNSSFDSLAWQRSCM